ncbi:serine/threonine protein kinase, partial [Microseira sp. BLCC-F43]
AETLKCESALSRPLTELIERKTQGNPFFITQFLKALHEDKYITFNRDFGYWECDLAQVKALSLTDDVVEFMANQLQKLPAQTQEILQLAACIGNSFDLETLAIVSERSPADAADALWKALQEGLILPQSEVYKFYLSLDEVDVNTDNIENVGYRFLHDRVQQAAYSLIPVPQRQRTHLNIGQLLLKNTTATERDEKIFEIVNQLNAGIELITAQAERDELAQLNLVAASKAKASTAYAAAVRYLIVGIELLGTDSWTRQYDLVLNFHLAAAEAEYLNSNFEQSQVLAEIALQHTKTLLEQVRVYEVKIQTYIAQTQLQEAIDTALQVLDMLEVSLEKEAPKELKIEELIYLPEMTEPHQMAVLRILNTISNAAYISNPTLYQQAVFTGINICIKSGNSPQGIYLYSFYSLMLYESGDIDASYLLGQLAVKLVEKFNCREFKSLVLAVFNSSIRHWKEQVKETIAPLREAFYSGLETGELIFSGYAILHHCSHLFFQGEILKFVEQKLQQYINLIHKEKIKYHVVYGQVWRQTLYNLLGLAEEPLQLTGQAFNEAEILPILVEQQNGTTLFAVYVVKSLLSYLFQQPELAIAQAKEAEKYQQTATGQLVTAEQKFYYSLALLADYPHTEQQEQNAYLKQVAANQVKMQMWAHHAPMNFLHKWQLVEAEKHRVLGNKTQAIEHYDLAISLAKENEYIQDEALANELAAKFYLDWGKEKVAASYMLEAYYCYAKWGALAKTND